MPPEQASGDVEAVDERADVFALGAILCEILTGHPPYSGRTLAEIHRKAVAGDLSEALDRLAGCGAEAELLDLARRCLARRAHDRHRDAGEVARAMTAYLAGVQERLRTAELARVEAQARTEEERKRRKTQFRMAAAILLALALGTAGVAFQWNRAEAHLRTAEAPLRPGSRGDRAVLHRGQRGRAAQGATVQRASREAPGLVARVLQEAAGLARGGIGRCPAS